MNRNSLIELEVVELEKVADGGYHYYGTKRVLINPRAIAEVWPVETVKISERSLEAARLDVAGNLKAARLYTLNASYARFVTPASYAKLYGMLGA